MKDDLYIKGVPTLVYIGHKCLLQRVYQLTYKNGSFVIVIRVSSFTFIIVYVEGDELKNGSH